MGEWSRAESERLSTTAVASMTTASIPMHRTAPRATFRSRLSSRHGQLPRRRGDKSQATFEARRHRGHSNALRRAILYYEGRHLAVWQPQTPNWCHGFTNHQPPTGSIGRWRSRRRSSRSWPKGELFLLIATFLMRPRSRGAIGRSRATPGALPTAGRSTDGPDGRADGLPASGRG